MRDTAIFNIWPQLALVQRHTDIRGDWFYKKQ
jgi:hypothetical protein